jgi:hypothetical protein
VGWLIHLEEILIVSGMADTFGRIIDLGVNPEIEL